MRRLACLTVLLAAAGCKDEIEDIDPASLPPPSHLVDVVERALPEVGRASERTLILLGVAEGELARDPELAQARLTVASLTLRDVELPSVREGLRLRLVQLWCRTGSLERAQGLVDEIADPELRADAQVHLTRALVEGGELAAAEAQARAIVGASRRGLALLEVVRGHNRAGAREAAGRLVAAFGAGPERDQALAEIAEAYARAGKLPQAQAALTDTRSPHFRGAGQAAIVVALMKRNKRARARRMVGEIESDWMRVRALAGLFAVADEAGRRKAAARWLAAAKRRADDITDPLMRSSARVEIIERLVLAGRRDEAEQMLDAIDDIGSRRKMEADLVRMYAEAAQFERAAKILARVERDALWGGEAAGALARAYVERGRVSEALAAAGRIRAPDLRLPTVGYVAAIQAASERPPSAEDAAAVRRWLGASP